MSAQPLQRQPVNLSQLAGFVVDDLRRSAPEPQVEVVIEPGLLAVGDPTLLRQVLENLLGNAWKYSVRTEHARIDFARAERTGAPAFEVRDNGAGFDMRSADRLFGLFQRLHSASDFPGTGVGLASVKRIVQRHGGQVSAESAPGRGARFFFTLPYSIVVQSSLKDARHRFAPAPRSACTLPSGCRIECISSERAMTITGLPAIRGLRVSPRATIDLEREGDEFDMRTCRQLSTTL